MTIGKRRGSGSGDSDRRVGLTIKTAATFDFGKVMEWARPGPNREFRIPVRRPDDLLVFDLILQNLVLASGSQPVLERGQANAPGVLVVEFPPQSFGEEAYLEKANIEAEEEGKEVSSDPDYPPKNDGATIGANVPALPAARIRMAGPSRLAFTMPADVTSLDFTLTAVLDAMKSWPMRRDVLARPDPTFTFIAHDVSLLANYSEIATLIHADGSQTVLPGTVDLKLAAADAVFGPLEEWTSLRGSLSQRLEPRRSQRLNAALDAASREMTRRILGQLNGPEGCSAATLQAPFLQTLEQLADEFPGLTASDEAQQAGMVALSLAIAEQLVWEAGRGTLKIGAERFVELLPLFPYLLRPHAPSHDVTALELPYRLLVSPVGAARWNHATAPPPVQPQGRVELWHTRLTTSGDDHGPDRESKFRAIWSPDYAMSNGEIFPLLNAPPKPFRMPLDPLDRKMLVNLMAGYDTAVDEEGNQPYTPRASRADRLHLTALGALLDSEGAWETRPFGVDLEQWRHLATLGRDHYVRVVYSGSLCCFGHSASLIKVTERKFEQGAGVGAGRVAVLRQRFFIIVRERVRTYAGKDHPFQGRNFPFKQVEILTRVTPNLVEPGQGDSAVADESVYGGSIFRRQLFWPTVPKAGFNKGEDFRFEVVATDINGHKISMSVPLLFVSDAVNQNSTLTGEVRRVYNLEAKEFPDTRIRAITGGASVTYAPAEAGDAADTRLPTESVGLAAGALKPGTHHPRKPNYYPEVGQARVGVPALQKMLGRSDVLVSVVYPDVFKQHGFGASDPSQNAGRMFLHLETPYSLGFGGGGAAKSDSLGGLAAPQMVIQGLSKTMGPVAVNPAVAPAQLPGKLANLANGGFNPADFFGGATLLGGVDLGAVVKVAASLVGADVPKMVTRELPDRIEASFDWDTEIDKSDPLNLLIPGADGQNKTTLVMNATVITPLAKPDDTDYFARATMLNFKVNLFGFVTIWFEELSFNARKGQKPDVAVQLRAGDDAVQFGGALEFVNELRNIIPSNGFSDPPLVSVTPSGIGASYSLTLPTVGVGIFTLSNLSLGAGFSLPFDANPATVNFFFATREQPFSLTVSLFGGGGFFAIGLSTRGVNEIEAALEFGAGIAIDLGVASGSVEVKAGVYFHWLEPEPNKGSIQLSGYVRLHGELSVIGLISASLTFNLQLSYLKDQAAGESLVWGEATLVIEVEVLFFSASVNVHCRREFGGSESDPKFIDLIPNEDVWGTYCEAFAQEAA